METQVVLDSVRRVLSRYGDRSPSIIYAHMLERPVWVALNDRPIDSLLDNPYVLIGELVHQGVGALMYPAESRCMTVEVPRYVVDEVDLEVKERFIMRYDNRFIVKVCGTADAMYRTDIGFVPVELKTTRNHVVKKEWVWRSETYAWLYNKPYTILAVLNLVEGKEQDFKIRNPGVRRMTDRLYDWLLGRWPPGTGRPLDQYELVEAERRVLEELKTMY